MVATTTLFAAALGAVAPAAAQLIRAVEFTDTFDNRETHRTKESWPLLTLHRSRR